MLTTEKIDAGRIELSLKAKNGINFTFSAALVWLLIAIIWMLPYKPYDKSVLTFMVGSLMLPLAFLFSKVFKTTWTVKGNALQPLGLYLNFAQLFYFPFLVFTFLKLPDYFVMVYAIITGAHFFPYAWFYKTNLYAIYAGIISIGAMALGLSSPVEKIYFIALFVGVALFSLTALLYMDYSRKYKKHPVLA